MGGICFDQQLVVVFLTKWNAQKIVGNREKKLYDNLMKKLLMIGKCKLDRNKH